MNDPLLRHGSIVSAVHLGFQQFHDDGTELMISAGVPPTIGNVCIGVWQRAAGGVNPAAAHDVKLERRRGAWRPADRVLPAGGHAENK